MLIIKEAIYYSNTIASITKNEQNIAIEASSLDLAGILSNEEVYKVFIGKTGRYEIINTKKTKIIDVYYFFNNDIIKSSVDIKNNKVVRNVKIEANK